MTERPTTDDDVASSESSNAIRKESIGVVDASEEISSLLKAEPHSRNTFQEREELGSNAHEHDAETLHTQAAARYAEFKRDGRLDSLEEAVQLHRQALKLRPDPHPDRSSSLGKLANALQRLFEHGDSDGPKHLKEAIELRRQALQLTPDVSSLLRNQTIALETQFYNSGNLSLLEEVIDLKRRLLQLTPDPHPDRSAIVDALGATLHLQFEYGGGFHLDEAIELHRQALDLRPDPHPNRSDSLSNLAAALHSKYEQSGDVNLLEEGIEMHRQALKLRPSPHPDRFSSLNNLAAALITQYARRGGINILEEAIDLHRQAVQISEPHPHPRRSGSLSNLGYALEIQFKQDGGVHLLEEAISLHRQALELRTDGHPNRSDSMTNLGNALQSQFNHGGGLNILEEAIRLHRQALELIPYPHPDRSMSLNNLANALHVHFNHTDGKPEALEEAIALHREALKLKPHPHPFHSISLDNLAIVLQDQFRRGGGLNVIEEAIQLHKQSLNLRPDPHPNRLDSLNNLAMALQFQFDRDGSLNHLEEAIQLLEPILQMLSISLVDPSPKHRRSLQSHDSYLNKYHTLATIYIAAHEASGGGNNYLTKSMLAFSSVLHFPFSSPFSQIKYAITWAKYADFYHQPSALEAYDFAIRLLPQSSSFGYSTRQRQLNMATHKMTRALASNASQYVIRENRFDKAIEYQEAARAILWSQLLQLRSPFLDRLNDVAPEIGKRLADISRVLETASHTDSTRSVIRTADSDQLQLTTLAIEWKQKVDEVRKIEGFEDFLLPHRLSSLQKAASNCPVAILIPHDSGSYCLVMTSVTIHSIAIPNLATERLRILATSIKTATLTSSRASNAYDETHTSVDSAEAANNDNNDRLKGTRVSRDGLKPDDLFRSVLEELWKELVKPVIDILSIKKSKSEPRPTIQWCPTGLFTFLPIHAAGIYTAVPATPPSANVSEHLVDECTSNYIISSYTPTIGALITPEPSPPSSSDFKMLAVISGSNLSHTKKELQNIKTRVPKECLTEVGVKGVSAHIESVVSHLPTSSIVHFACHGIQDKSNPLDSGLSLDDGMLTIAKIMKQPLPNGSLAFLCACETSMGDEELPDESISIGASLVFSGFSSVIATMWRMMDRHGPTIAGAFYEELFRGPDGNPTPVPDFSRSAQALDLAVKKLRDSGVPFYEWVPFIHLGKAK